MRRPDDDCDRGRDADRGQSEALGFALLFAMIIVLLGIIVTVGYANLVDARDHERVNNAERGFEALAANVDEVVRSDAASRSTELAVADGRLVTRSETTMTVEWSPEGSSDSTNRTVALTALVYADGSGDRVVYEGGAVFREDDSGAVLVEGPSLLLDESRTVVPIVQLDGRERVGAAGKELISLRTERNHAESGVLIADTSGNYTLTITVSGPRAEAWKQYLVSRSDGSCSETVAGVECSDIQRLTVIYVVVDVSQSA